VPHGRYFDFSGIIDELRARHDDRFAVSPEFRLLQKEIDFLKEQRAKTSLSLNIDKRTEYHSQVEKTRLAIANARREIRGDEPFDTLDQLDDWQDQQTADLDSTDEDMDFIVEEGGNIMADMLELDQRMASILSPKQITAQTK
jgi:carboxyl-terminal processing protease